MQDEDLNIVIVQNSHAMVLAEIVKKDGLHLGIWKNSWGPNDKKGTKFKYEVLGIS